MLIRFVHKGDTTSGSKRPGACPTNEPLPCLLWTELDEWSPAHGEAEHVGRDVVSDHHHDWQDEPDHTLKHVLRNRDKVMWR